MLEIIHFFGADIIIRSLKSETGTPSFSSMDPSSTISSRLAHYLQRVRHLETENTQSFLNETDTRLAQQNEVHNKALNDLRDQYETQMQSNRDKIKYLLKTKLTNAEKKIQRDKVTLQHTLKTLRVFYNRIDDNEAQISVLEEINSSLQESIRNLQITLQTEQSRSAKYQTEIHRLREELALKLEEYQTLIDEEADNSLSVEIAEFDKLLSKAEKRFKSSSS